MRNTLLLIVILASMSSCLKKVDVGDFDRESWQNDPKGCLSERPDLIQELNKHKKAMLGLYQKDVISVLGQPEEQELYKRSQTYYIYYIDAAPGCQNPVENPRKLYIRFTSLGIANEITIK
jgi:hypothetical protein